MELLEALLVIIHKALAFSEALCSVFLSKAAAEKRGGECNLGQNGQKGTMYSRRDKGSGEAAHHDLFEIGW